MADGAKGQGKGGARKPPKLSGRSRTGSQLSLTPKVKLFLGQATPLGLACQKTDGHFEVDDLLSRWQSRVAEQKFKGKDDYTTTMLCMTMAQMMIDRAVRRMPDAQSTTLKDLYSKQGESLDEWASSLKQAWGGSSPLGEEWHAKAEEWLGAQPVPEGVNPHVLKKELEQMLAEVFMQKGEIDMDTERARLATVREAQIGCMNTDQLKPRSLKDIDWKVAKRVSFFEDAGCLLVELADHEAVVIGGNTHNAVHAVAAKGILQTLNMKHQPTKILHPLLAEWEECIRAVVGVVDEAQAPGVIEFLTGKAISKEDFRVSAASLWTREVLIIAELNPGIKQPLLLGECEGLTQAQLEDIGGICATDLLFNNCKMLAEQVGLVKSDEDGEVITSMVQCVNAEPDGMKRTSYMGQLGEIMEDIFTENSTDEAVANLRKIFWWGDAQLSDDQMGMVLTGVRKGLKSCASKPWTKESLTKLINKTFRGVKEDVGMSSVDDIMDFLVTVQDEIEEVVQGVTMIYGMCGTKSVVSIAMDF